ncbi:MAG: nuclear transport factor 2 family protein [Acidimicrobiales bacterium]
MSDDTAADADTATVTERNRHAVTVAFERFVAGDAAPFFALVADDVRWVVIGTTDISGTYTSKRSFIAEATSKLFGAFAGPLVGSIRNVLADRDHVVVQWDGHADLTAGGRYDQSYCWVLRLGDGLVVEATAYLDTEAVTAALP